MNLAPQDDCAIPWRTRLYRVMFKSELCDSDGRVARRVRTVRWIAAAALLWLFLAFLTESFRAWNFFSGNA